MRGTRTARAVWATALVLVVGGGCCHCGKKAEPAAGAVQGQFDSGPPGSVKPAAGAPRQNPLPERIHDGIL